MVKPVWGGPIFDETLTSVGNWLAGGSGIISAAGENPIPAQIQINLEFIKL
jgi:hypothetical protein